MPNPDFITLLKPHYSDAVNYCRALCSGSSKAEAEDVMQQALMKGYEHFGSLEDQDKFRSWFFQILTRCFYDAVRKPFWSRFISLQSGEAEAAFEVFEEDYFEDNQLLIGALAQLSKKERAAILLFEIGGFSIKEITEMQGEGSESAIKSRLSRARSKLKEFIEQAEGKAPDNTVSISSVHQRTSKDLYYETSKTINEIKSIG